MAEIVKKSVITDNQGRKQEVVAETKRLASDSQTIEYLIYFFFGALEILLGFRLILRLMGASMASGFVNFVYALSRLFILPFEGIFRPATTQGIETVAVLEPATIVAMIVYAVLFWGMAKLVQIFSGEQQTD